MNSPADGQLGRPGGGTLERHRHQVFVTGGNDDDWDVLTDQRKVQNPSLPVKMKWSTSMMTTP